jgi:PAS domain S-box-containing protein
MHARQQAIVAELGLHALAPTNLDDLFAAVLAGLSEGSGAECCSILELLPGGDELRVRAGAGWRTSCAITVPVGAESHGGYAMLSSEPVMVDDFSTETRFRVPAYLTNEAVVSGVNVVVPGRSRVFGTLGVYTRAPRKFTADDVNFLQSVANVLAAAIERRSTDEALQRSERNFRTLIEASPDGVVVHRQGRVVYVNPAIVSSLGHEKAAELLDKPVLELVHPDDRAMVSQRLAAREGGTGPDRRPSERRLLRKDGSMLVVEVVGLPVTFEGGEAIMAITRDLTERMHIQQRLRIADRMASVGMLAAGVAHEINNPLAYVTANLGYLGEALKRLDPGTIDNAAELGDVLEEAHEGCERIRQIVRDLKMFSREDEAPSRPVELKRVVESSINMAWNEIRHRARLVKDFTEVPPVLAKESRLGQVFLNLLVNAAQAIPEGGADRNEIRVTLRSEADRVLVEVRDTGSGIPPETLPRIFDPLFTTKPVGIGTGLGLSISHSIVRGMGGEITVDSVIGKGTTFTVSLPACERT